MEGESEPYHVSPKHIFMYENLQDVFAADASIVNTKDGFKKIIKKEDGFKKEPLYDISINNMNAPIGQEHFYYDSRGMIHHNSFFAMKLLKNAQKKGLDCIYIDTEFAYDDTFAKNVGVDTNNILVYQNNHIEDLQEFVMKTFKGLTKPEKRNIFIVIDSWNGMVTSKTVGDAEIGKDVSDMTISKKKNTFARLLTGLHCTIHVVNQVYDNIMDMYDPLSIPGGRGLFFASSTVILGTSKAKSKDGDEVNGILVTARTKKSRFCQENTKIKYLIKYDGGIHPTYGIDDDLFEFGYLLKPAMGWYQRDFAKLGLEGEDRKWRAKEMLEKWQEFYKPILNCVEVKKAFENKYTFKDRGMLDLEEDLKFDETLEEN